MFTTIINDMMGIVQAEFLNGDWVSMAIAFGSVLIAALFLNRASQVGGMTLFALVLFAIGGMVRAFLTKPAADAAASEGGALGHFERGWAQFMDMPAGVLFAYFICFMVLILVFYVIKSVIRG